jgi:hypothetical protein
MLWGKKLLSRALLVLLLALLPVVVSGQGNPPLQETVEEGWVIPHEEWTPEAHVWLARAVRAEEQIALAYVLAKRYHLFQTRGRNITFLWMTRTYCSGMKPTLKVLSERQKWSRDINLAGDQPAHWPKKLSWKKHKKYWLRTVEALDIWVRGGYIDPCPKAIHWGGPMDIPMDVRMYPLKCTKQRDYGNTLYEMR